MGDIITVSMNDKKYDMPLVSNYSDVDPGSMMCRLAINENKKKNRVVLGINMGELASWSGIAVREDTDNETGYRWIISEGIPDPVPVSIILKEAKGYIRQLSLHKLVKSDNRDDYPNLDDAEFANFREITTTGVGRNALYRSSSPVNPGLNRNTEADLARSAEDYLGRIGLSDETITDLREKLTRNY